jgi:hypothetical protein
MVHFFILHFPAFYSGFRAVESFTRNMYHFAAHLNDRLVFRDFGMLSRIPKVLQEVSTMKFGVNIGDESRRDGGLSGNFKLIKMDNPGAYYKQLKVAVDSGTVIVMDWLFHTDTTDEQGTRAAQVTRQFLSKFQHFFCPFIVPFLFCWFCTKLLFIYSVFLMRQLLHIFCGKNRI